jgi:hypothetical protein
MTLERLGPDHIHQCARESAALGFLVFPVENEKKKPRYTGWQQSATSDPELVDAMYQRDPSTNYGIRTGPEAGIVVLDIDLAHGGSREALERFVGGSLPATPEVVSGGGGSHLYFAYPGGEDIPNTSGELGAGLDVRGVAGLVVGPGSVHWNGAEYQWRVHPRDVPLAPLPEQLLALVRRERKTPTKGDPVPDGAVTSKPLCTRFLSRAKERLFDRDGKPRKGRRREICFWLCCQPHDHRVKRELAVRTIESYQEFVAGHGDRLRDHGFSRDEALAVLDSVLKGAPRPPALLVLPDDANTHHIEYCWGLVSSESRSVEEQDAFAAGALADAMSSSGSLKRADSAASRRRLRQHGVFGAYFASLWPGHPISKATWKQIAAGMAEAGYDESLCVTLMNIAAWVKRNPHALTSSPRLKPGDSLPRERGFPASPSRASQ